MDFLMPLAASVVCREGGLSPEDSLAMTAAALVIQGPLALAPAIVAVETQRSSGSAPPAKGDIGPALVPVPNVVDKSEDEAIKALNDAKLRSRVVYNRATGEASAGRVLRQSLSPKSVDLVPENTLIEVNVAKVQTGATPPDEEQVTEAELEASLARVKTAVDERLTAMEQKLDRALELLAGGVKAQTKA